MYVVGVGVININVGEISCGCVGVHNVGVGCRDWN